MSEEKIFTEEQLKQPITIDRIREYHYEVGEDFLDQNETIIVENVFFGYLMGRFPKLTPFLLEVLNQRWSSINNLTEHPKFSYSEKIDMDKVYIYVVEFVNKTDATKRRFNQALLEAIN